MLHSGSGAGFGAGSDGASGPFAPPPNTVSFTVTWPTTVQAVYRFYDGPGGTGTLLKTVTINFVTAQTPSLLSGEVS